MAQKFWPGGSPANYTIGGTRVWFNRLVDDSTDPVKYEGFRDLGNIIDAPRTLNVDKKDHFSARSGARIRDARFSQILGEDIVVQFDELSLDNLRNFCQADTVTDIDADTAVPQDMEVHQLNGVETTIIGKGYKASSIVVKDFTGMTTYTADTDYEVVDVIGGWKGIRRIDGAGIASNDFVQITFSADVRVHKQLAPGELTVINGKCIMFRVSKRGVEFFRQWNLATIEPDGDENYIDTDWTKMKMRISVLDNSEVDIDFPFGVLEYYGVGAKLWHG